MNIIRTISVLLITVVLVISGTSIGLADGKDSQAVDVGKIKSVEEFEAAHAKWLKSAEQTKCELEVPDSSQKGNVLLAKTNQAMLLYTPTVLNTATEGLDGGSTWGFGSRSDDYVLASRRNNTYSYCGLAGGADSWAWTGNRFLMGGSGSYPAYVDFAGWAKAEMVTAMGASSSADFTVRGRVYDVTSSTWIGNVTIYDVSATNGETKTPGGNYAYSCFVTFQAGHTYVVLVETEVGVSHYGLGSTLSHSNTTPFHTYWNTITLRWL